MPWLSFVLLQPASAERTEANRIAFNKQLSNGYDIFAVVVVLDPHAVVIVSAEIEANIAAIDACVLLQHQSSPLSMRIRFLMSSSAIEVQPRDSLPEMVQLLQSKFWL